MGFVKLVRTGYVILHTERLVPKITQACRIAGFCQAYLSVGHQTGGRSALTIPLEVGPREVVKNSSGNCGVVRTHCKAGQLKQALHILNQRSIRADSNTYRCLLQECIHMNDLVGGKQVHTHIIQSGLKPNIFLLNTLIDMYAKCGSVMDARQMFSGMSERSLVTWTIMIAGYAKNGHAEEAVKIYEQMQREGVMSDRVTFICVLSACASLGVLQRGKEVHADIIRTGIVSDINLETALFAMYAKCGSMKDARQVFDNMVQRDVVSWNAMIGGYAQHGCSREALTIYGQMQQEGVTPDRVTFVCVLNACASLGALRKGRVVHADALKAGKGSYINVENALIDMYAKCGSMKDAREVFDSMSLRDIVSWNSMIAGYTQHGCGRDAVKVYEQMLQEGFRPNRVTFICILNACGILEALEKGKEVHDDIIKGGIAPYINLENTLVDMYAKCGSMKDARQLFDNMSRRNVVSWTAMISGYSRHGCGWEAFEIYDQMQQKGVTPDSVTFICILNLCAREGALEKGKEVHADIIKVGMTSYINLENTLVDMYAKCGSMEDAHDVFNNMPQRDNVSWNTMLAGCAQHGCGREVLQLFERMKQEGLRPNSITYTSLLSACSHVGLVDEGCHYFVSMSDDHGLSPTLEHFGCMVDLLGRAGRLVEAEAFINKAPMEQDAGLWVALLGACRIHGDVDLAERVANCLLKCDLQHAATYVLLSNMYAAADRWDDRAKLRKMMEDIGLIKEPGHSCVEVDNQVHTFIAEEKSHPKMRKFMLS